MYSRSGIVESSTTTVYLLVVTIMGCIVSSFFVVPLHSSCAFQGICNDISVQQARIGKIEVEGGYLQHYRQARLSNERKHNSARGKCSNCDSAKSWCNWALHQILYSNDYDNDSWLHLLFYTRFSSSGERFRRSSCILHLDGGLLAVLVSNHDCGSLPWQVRKYKEWRDAFFTTTSL